MEKDVEIKKEVSEHCKDFLLSLLIKEVLDRMIFEDSLQHPWLVETGH